MAKGGVYEIVNTRDNIKYIGSSVQVATRIMKHKSYLEGNCHQIPKMQADYNRHGSDNFEFNILFRSDNPQALGMAEHKQINKLGEQDYNIRNVRMEPLNEIGSLAWVAEMRGYIDCSRGRAG